MSLAVLLNSNRSGLFTGKKVIIIPNQSPSWLSKIWFIWVLPHHSFAHPCIFPGYQALVACCHDNLLLDGCRDSQISPRGLLDQPSAAVIRKGCKPALLWKSSMEIRCHHSELFRGLGQCIITSLKCIPPNIIRVRGGVRAPHRKIWYDLEQNSSPSHAAVFYYKGFFYLSRSILLMLSAGRVWLWARQCFVL